MDDVLSVLLGVMIGGLGLSTSWGVFWCVMASAGFARRTCDWRVVQASLTAALAPGVLLGVVLWTIDPGRLGSLPFAAGVSVLPVVGVILGMRTLPDGTRVVGRLVGGTQAMMDTILGRHHDCGGCGEEHHHHEDQA
ncbi:MAG TPA: hypothetical protein VEI50_09975 [Nitrospiraceae bacterium]|nr:hypothetical protein [Nitrospiraceae bacterium]